jgi:hypothetical protein
MLTVQSKSSFFGCNWAWKKRIPGNPPTCTEGVRHLLLGFLHCEDLRSIRTPTGHPEMNSLLDDTWRE